MQFGVKSYLASANRKTLDENISTSELGSVN